MTCKTCRYLGVPLDKAGRRVVRVNKAYPCTVPLVGKPMLPDSITHQWSFRWPPGRIWMRGSEGVNCPTYEKLTKEPT